MSENTINISLREIFESRVLMGQVSQDIPFWTGVIDSSKVDEFLVKNNAKRLELKQLIEQLEDGILKIRNNRDKSFFKINIELQVCVDKIMDIIVNYSDIELYLIYIIQKFDLIRTQNPEESKKISPACTSQINENRKIFMKQNAVFAYPIFAIEIEEYGFETELIKEQENQVKRNGNEKKLIALLNAIYGEKLEEEKELEILDEVSGKLLLSDLLESLISPNLKSLFYESVVKNYLLKSGMNRDEINALTREQLAKVAEDMELPENKNLCSQVMSDTMLSHIEYFSIDKFGLIFLQRCLEEYNRIAQTSYDISELLSESRKVEAIIKRVLSAGIILGSTSMNVKINEEKKKLTAKDIRLKQKEFTDGLYLTPDVCLSIRDMLFENRVKLSEFSQDIRTKLQFTGLDLETIALVNLENLKVLFEDGRVNKDFIERLIRNCSLDIYTALQEQETTEDNYMFNNVKFPSTVELISFLLNNNLISCEDIYKYYMSNVIKFEEVEKVFDNNEKMIPEMSGIISEDELLAAYKRYLETKKLYENALNSNSESEINKYKNLMELERQKKNKIILLYKKYKETSLTSEQKNNFIDENVLRFCIENDDSIIIETLVEMYKDGIISFENILSLDKSYLQTVIIDIMFVRGELTLEDTQKLRDTIPLDVLVGIINKAMINTQIEQTEKFCLIRNIFHRDKKDDDVAKSFLKQLRAKKYVGVKYEEIKKLLDKQEDNKDKEDDDDNKKTNTSQSSKKHVYPQYIKWMFLKALDKEATIRLYGNGYVEVYSKKLGVRIIEKYLEVDRKGCKFDEEDAYGYATYIMRDDVYRENLEYLVDSHIGSEMLLNTRTLLHLVSGKDRIVHNTKSPSKNWMRSMAKKFEIDLETELELVSDSRYTKEELAYIRYVILTYENKHIEIDER